MVKMERTEWESNERDTMTEGRHHGDRKTLGARVATSNSLVAKFVLQHVIEYLLSMKIQQAKLFWFHFCCSDKKQ